MEKWSICNIEEYHRLEYFMATPFPLESALLTLAGKTKRTAKRNSQIRETKTILVKPHRNSDYSNRPTYKKPARGQAENKEPPVLFFFLNFDYSSIN